MKKTFLTLVTVLGLGAYSFAQIHIGATTAVNSTFVLDKGLSEDPRYNSTATYQWAPIGFSFGVDFGKSFGLQLESIISNQGQIFDVIDRAKQVVGERKIDLDYLQLPLLFRFMSGSDSKVRPNFSLGPQLSLLTGGVETLDYLQSSQFFPEGGIEDLVMNQDGTVNFMDVANNLPIEGATLNPDGSYDLPALESTELLTKNATEQIKSFADAELQIAGSFGVDIDVAKNISLSTVIRANYAVTDMRNGDLIDALKNNTTQDIFGKRANLLVGVQVGVNYYFSGTRFFK